MTNYTFFKYQATGNDFIIIDDRDQTFSSENIQLISRLCDRRFGIGADGLILIRDHDKCQFEMVYFNADGSQSLCGNGSRCAIRFMVDQGLLNTSQPITFMAYDGIHKATVLENGQIGIAMHNVSTVKRYDKDLFIDTGSPHYIKFTDNVQAVPVVQEGAAIRNSEPFRAEGTNVNFVELTGTSTIHVRTYERGVENETLSCGTGVTAASLAASLHGCPSPVHVVTPGGELMVSFVVEDEGHFSQIELIGPAKHVFSGTFRLAPQPDIIAGV